MNYKEYIAIKRACNIRIRVFSVAIYAITIVAIVQSYFLFMQVEYDLKIFNLYLLELLYRQGASKMSEGNTIFGYLFFSIYGACVLSFVFATVMTFHIKRFPYALAFVIYFFDMLLCLMMAQYYHALFHIFLLMLIILAMRNRSYINMLKNNIWGYD